MDLSFNDLLLISEGLDKVKSDTQSVIVFMSSAMGADQTALARMRNRVAEIDDLRKRVETAIGEPR